MDCKQAQELMSAVLDGQASLEQVAAWQAHRLACPACAEHWDELRSLDGKLRRAAQPRRMAAGEVAERVAQQIAESPPISSPSFSSVRRASAWPRRPTAAQVVSWLVAMAAGFLIAALVFQPWKRAGGLTGDETAGNNGGHDNASISPEHSEKPVAHLVAATGDVAIRRPEDADWSVIPVSSLTPPPIEAPRSGGCGAGTTIRTDPGVRCEVQTSDGCVIRLNDESQVTFRSARQIEVHQGQVWCSAPDDVAMEVCTGAVEDEPATKSADRLVWTFVCPSRDASLISTVEPKRGVRLTAARGEVELRAGDARHRLPPGETVTLKEGQFAPLPHHEDALRAATWIDSLLVKKGHANPELLARVDDLLAKIGDAKSSLLHEQELRGLGEHCVLPLLRYVQSSLSNDHREQRRKAMRIAADLAPAWAIEDLISLLKDEDEEIRYQAATALRRLTGQNQGREPEAWRSPWAECTPTVLSWQAWWQRNRERYPNPDFLKAIPVPEVKYKKA